MKNKIFISLALFLSSCASITNDAFVPISLSFSDGSSGTCFISNKRMSLETNIPGTAMVRRSDDNLDLRCKTDYGQEANAAIPSTIGGKIIASAVFLDLGITDAITDKHREYPASYVINVKK